MANTVTDRLDSLLDGLGNVKVSTLKISMLEKCIVFPSLYMHKEIPEGFVYKGIQLKINNNW